MKDGQRHAKLDEIADLGTAASNAIGVSDADGRDVIARIRMDLAGHPQAAAYDVQGGHGSGHADPTWSAAPSRRGDASIDKAAALLREIDTRIERIYDDLTFVTHAFARHLTRPPRSSERQLAELEEERAEEARRAKPSCRSCARLSTSNGERYIVEADHTTDVRTSRTNPDTARLKNAVPLCRRCEEWVRDTVAPGSKLALEAAIPTRIARKFKDGERVMRPAS